MPTLIRGRMKYHKSASRSRIRLRWNCARWPTFGQGIPVLPLQPTETSTRSKCVPTSTDPAVLTARVNAPRPRRVDGAGQESFGAPQKQIVTDQKDLTFLLAARGLGVYKTAWASSAAVFASLPNVHRAQRVRTDRPHKARTLLDVQAIADRVGAAVKQGCPTVTTGI